jgi:hypothetical protein
MVRKAAVSLAHYYQQKEKKHKLLSTAAANALQLLKITAGPLTATDPLQLFMTAVNLLQLLMTAVVI